MTLTIRPITPADIPQLLAMIRELATFEQLADTLMATPEQLHQAFFASPPAAEARVLEDESGPVGFLVFYTTFSTFVGKPGLYLEDVYITPEKRGQGYGQQALQYLAQLAHGRGYGRLEWAVLNWNVEAIRFYDRLGAVPLSDWTTYRLDASGITSLVSG